MHIDTTFPIEDFNKLSYFHSGLRARLQLLVILTAFFLLLAIFWILPDLYRGSISFTWFFILIILGASLLANWVSYFATRGTAKQKIKDFFKKEGSGSITYRYDIQQDGIRLATKSTDSFMKWEGFSKWAKTPEYYLLYHSSGSYWPVKASDIPTDQFREFETILSTNIKAAK
jgi:hypothetical protein